jgi:hypothetical protein
MLKYCSPIITFTPTAVRITQTVARNCEFKKLDILFNIVGIIPKLNKSPPKLNAKITIVIVKNILFMPPLFKRCAKSEGAFLA